jgi:exodeoxyribonuclease V beta subunit
VVFCPTLWQRSERLKKEQLLVHCHENGQMIADLGSAQFAERKQTALYEELAEDLRLFYVAVTRAKYRCYLSWADVRTKEHPNDSALAYLLGFAHLNFSEQQQKLQAIAQTFPQQFAYHLLPNDKQISDIYQAKVTKPHLSYRPFNRQLSTTWLMSSYTALSALSQQFVPELPEDKAVETNNDVQIESYLPKGAQMGNVVHSLLEKLSFQRLAQAEDYSKDLAQTLSQYGVQLDAPELVTQLLQTVTHSALSTDTEFCLKNIAAPHCIKEMPFYLSMSHLDTDGINQILADSPTYQPLSHKQLRGYLTGFIDLICCYQGQYYVMDYKTNCLADYQPETILTAMREHNYGLQYWLYSVVLDAYLQQRLTAYNYQQHFGGVKYLFVRGMHPARPGYAVYADKPMQHKLKALANLLMNKENS